MQQDAEALAKPRFSLPRFPHLFRVTMLHLLEVRGNDRLFSREEIVGGPGSNLGSTSNVPHGGNFKAATTKELQSGAQDQFPGILAPWPGRLNHGITRRLEHVQMLTQTS